MKVVAGSNLMLLQDVLFFSLHLEKIPAYAFCGVHIYCSMNTFHDSEDDLKTCCLLCQDQTLRQCNLAQKDPP